MRILFFGLILVIGLFMIKFVPQFIPQERIQLPYNSTFDFQNKKVSYRKIGNGNPVILLHGSLLSNPWGGWEQKLAKHNTVYLPELPGYGASDSINNEVHNTALFTKVLCAFIKDQKLEKSPLIAFSYGTVVAIKVNLENCTTGKLILVGVPTKVSGKEFEISQKIPLHIKRFLASTRFGKIHFIVPVIYQNIGSKISDVNKALNWINNNDPKVSADVNIQKEINEEIPTSLLKLKTGTIFIYGENDNLRNDLIKNYQIIKNSGHNIFVDQPEISLEVIQKYL